MDPRVRDRNEAEVLKRIQAAQRTIDERFLARPIRVLPIELRRERDRNRPFLEKMGDIDHLLSNAFKVVGKKIRKKLDLINEVDIIEADRNIAKDDPRYHIQFDFNWDNDYSQELQMNILETLKQKYFNWCVYHTYDEIMELGRPNWWGLSLEEQHRNSPKYIEQILEQASIGIERELYTYRMGYQEQTIWVDTSYGDVTGGANGEPPYLDPARCKMEGVRYTGPDLNNPRNARIFTGPGIIYNKRLYNPDGSLTHVEPLPQFHFLAIGSLDHGTRIDIQNCIEFRRREMELEEQGVLDPKDRLPAQWGLGDPDDFYKQIKIPFENSKEGEVKNYTLEDILIKREEIKRVYRLDTPNPVLQTRCINGVRNREYCNPFDDTGRNRPGGTFTPNRNQYTLAYNPNYTTEYYPEDKKPHPLEYSEDYVEGPNIFHPSEYKGDFAKTDNYTIHVHDKYQQQPINKQYKNNQPYKNKQHYEEQHYEEPQYEQQYEEQPYDNHYDTYEEYPEPLGNIEDLGMPVTGETVDRAMILQALGRCLPDEYDKNDPMAIERLRARLKREEEERNRREEERYQDEQRAKAQAEEIRRKLALANQSQDSYDEEDEYDIHDSGDMYDRYDEYSSNDYEIEMEEMDDEMVSYDEIGDISVYDSILDNPIGERIKEEKSTIREELKPTVLTNYKASESIMGESDFVGYVDYNMSSYKKELLETLPSSGPGEVFRVLQKFRGYAFAFHDGRFINEMKNKGTVNFNETSNRRNRYKSRKYLKDELGYFPVFMLIADGKLLDDYEYFLKTYNKCIPSGANFLFVSEIKDDDVIVDANKWQDLERYIDTGVDNNGVSKYKSLSDIEYVERDDCELVLRMSLDAEDVLEIYDVAI